MIYKFINNTANYNIVLYAYVYEIKWLCNVSIDMYEIYM